MTAQDLQSLKNRFDIIGNDPALNDALQMAVAVAPTDITVLVSGESGVGKENIPKIIHAYSRRKTAKYFAVNCGAIPSGTADSELFGHEKGAFTGAVEMRKGYFEEADGGTLFLDEIGELPMESQARLLRVLQNGEFIRVGSSKVQKTDVRVVAATNVNLEHLVSKGKFRVDLYYRLNAVKISMPSLRERPEDINTLFRKFSSDFAVKYQRCRLKLTEDASKLLRQYRWPGNIRQLKNVAEHISAIESAKVSAHNDICTVNAEVLASYLPKEDVNLLPATFQTKVNLDNPEEFEAILRLIHQLKKDVDAIKEIIAASGVSVSSGTPISAMVPVSEDKHQPYPVEEVVAEDPEEQEFFEKDEKLSIKSKNEEIITKVLEKHKGNRKAAAKELEISERTLYRKIKSMNEEK